ncbi:Uncharacterised protein [Vibrio cholerae]|nr:Uncharacterised protein [Vibrio cholerae]
MRCQLVGLLCCAIRTVCMISHTLCGALQLVDG